MTPKMGAGIGSPAVGMLGLGAFVTRTGMTPAGMGADLGGMAEGIGGTLALTAHDQEDERRRKIERIVNLMGRRWGRVSPDGVERCAQRVGFEYVWEGGSDPKRTLSIAGQGVLIDVEFMSEQVQHVGLSFPTGGEEAMRAAPEGAEVLKRDLQGTGKGYVMLDRFVTNLERLATMDRLGVGGVSSFDAVDGIGACLRSLFGWEMQKLQKEGAGQDDRLDWETAVMCTGSGRPQMHSRGRMGLSLQYWRERRFLGRPHRGTGMEMDVDGPSRTSRRKREPVVYSALIDCEACSSDIYPPIRISSAWLSDAVGKPSEELDAFSGLFGETTVDWQEPLPTLISSEEDAAAAAAATTTTDANANPTVDPMSIDGVALIATGKTPNVRFVARLDPPVIVPLQVALVIYDSVGAPIAQESITPTTFEALLFPNGANALTTSKTTNPSSFTSLTPPPTTQPPQANHTAVEQTITTYDANGCPIPSKHKYTLFNPTQSLAHAIENIPFSHPRQIIAMLPYLRQWALLGSILRRSFNPIPHPSPSPSFSPLGSLRHQRNQMNSEHEPAQQDAAESPTEKDQTTTTTLDEQLAAFLNSGNPHKEPLHSSSSPSFSSSTAATTKEELTAERSPAPAPLAVDISIAFTPAPPRLTCVFELEGQLRSVVLGVNVNGEVAVLDLDTGKDTNRGVSGGAAAGGAGGAAGGASGDQQAEAQEEQTTKKDLDSDLDVKMKAQIKKVLEISESIGAVVAWLAGASRRRGAR